MQILYTFHICRFFKCSYISVQWTSDSIFFILSCLSWYFGNISRKAAEANLQNLINEERSFLVRKSEKETNNYALSVKYVSEDTGIKHYRIKSSDDGRSFFIKKGDTFDCLYDLVEHHKGMLIMA